MLSRPPEQRPKARTFLEDKCMVNNDLFLHDPDEPLKRDGQEPKRNTYHESTKFRKHEIDL